MENKIKVQTDCGELTVCEYDDGIANGAQIYLGDELVALVDCYRQADDDDLFPEARLLYYGPNGPDECDEPKQVLPLN